MGFLVGLCLCFTSALALSVPDTQAATLLIDAQTKRPARDNGTISEVSTSLIDKQEKKPEASSFDQLLMAAKNRAASSKPDTAAKPDTAKVLDKTPDASATAAKLPSLSSPTSTTPTSEVAPTAAKADSQSSTTVSSSKAPRYDPSKYDPEAFRKKAQDIVGHFKEEMKASQSRMEELSSKVASMRANMRRH